MTAADAGPARHPVSGPKATETRGQPSQHLEHAEQDTAFRAAMAHAPTFVTVVAAHTEHGPVGCTANAVLSLSLRPPSLVVSLAATSRTAQWIRRAGGFSISMLAWGQRDLVWSFSQGEPCRRFDDVPYTNRQGQPVLDGSAVSFVCRTEEQRQVWDHLLLIGRVLSSDHQPEATPLIHHDRTEHPCPTSAKTRI